MKSRWLGALLLAGCSVICTGVLAATIRFDFNPEHLNPVLPGEDAGVLQVPIRRSPAVPRLNGTVDREAWEGMTEIPPSAFVIPEPPTRVRLSYDEGHLYVQVECSNDPAFEPQAEPRPRNHTMRGDDHVHFTVKPFADQDTEYLFRINMAGSVYDARDLDESWDGTWRHAAYVTEDGWVAEAALPWALFGLEEAPPKVGFNVGRSGNGIIVRSWNILMHYSGVASRLVLVDSGPDGERAERDALPASSPNVRLQGSGLAVDLPRAEARPEDRWIDALLTLQPQATLQDLRIEVRLDPLGGGSPLATASLTPPAGRGRLSVDLRSHEVTEAELTIALFERGERIALARTFLAARSAPAALAGRRIPIHLDVPEGAEVAAGWPVTFGFPFPRGALWDVDTLRLVDREGREIPSQRAVGARWAREGAIQWVRFDALVDPADGYSVEAGNPTAVPEQPVRVTEDSAGRLILETGPARYVLERGPSPIAEAWHGEERLAASAGARGLYVIDQQGRLGTACAEEASMEIEAAGPVAASIRFEGWYRTADGTPLARHITRIEAFAGQPFAHITHTLVITEDTNELWFHEVGWEFSAAPGADARALFNIEREDPGQVLEHPLAAGAAAFMFQEEHHRFGGGTNRFTVSAGQEPLHSGSECGDWALLDGEQGGLLLACRETARQHPKEFKLTGDRFTLKLFSPRAGEALDFRGATLANKWNLSGAIAAQVARQQPNAAGWSKTHELLIAPLPAGAQRQAQQYAALRSTPVYALADPDWIYRSDAMGPVHPRDRENYPEVERLVDELFGRIYPRGHETGHYGFMDYYAGPCYGAGSGLCGAGRYRFTYGLRNSIWLAYARSGERAIRAFAEGTNKAFLDNYLVHWDTDEKTRGLYTSGSGRPLNQLPFYWGRGDSVNLSSSTNLDQFIWLYHLTGYRRARDAVEAFAEGLTRAWRHDDQQWRQLMVFRVLTQTYAFTWDQRLRALAAGTFDVFSDPESEVLLTKNRPYISSTYKTREDVRALIEGWQVFGEPKYREVANTISAFWWRHEVGTSPMGRMRALAHVGNRLYEESRDPAILSAMDFSLRRAGRSAASGGASSLCSVFEALPYTMGVIERYREPGRTRPWVAYRDYGYPSFIVARKRRDDILDFTVQTPRPRQTEERGAPIGFTAEAVGTRTGQQFSLGGVGIPGRWGRELDRVVQYSRGAGEARVPKDAPAGAYAVIPAASGAHFILAHDRVPMVLYAPGYWHLPDLEPAQAVYFLLPEKAENPRILLEGRARLFDPEGTPFGAAEGLRGWIDLPADRPGLWSFEPLENRIVRVRNLPPFFAFGDPAFYFEPEIEWPQQPSLEQTAADDPDDLYVAGASAEEHSRALHLTGNRRFELEAGPAHPSGDGGQYLPYEQGTIEFYFRPRWDTFDLGEGSAVRSFLRVVTDQSPWSLLYRIDPEGTAINLGPRDPSHSLYGTMHLENRAHLRVWRTQTLFERGAWTHIAWTWGPVIVPGPHGDPMRLMTMRVFVNGVGARMTIFRSAVDQLPAGIPQQLQIYPLDGAIDQLRISDVQRYRADFSPPARDRELVLDKHTRALFLLNETLAGQSYGTDSAPQGQLVGE